MGRKEKSDLYIRVFEILREYQEEMLSRLLDT